MEIKLTRRQINTLRVAIYMASVTHGSPPARQLKKFAKLEGLLAKAYEVGAPKPLSPEQTDAMMEELDQ